MLTNKELTIKFVSEYFKDCDIKEEGKKEISLNLKHNLSIKIRFEKDCIYINYVSFVGVFQTSLYKKGMIELEILKESLTMFFEKNAMKYYTINLSKTH